MNMLEKFLTEAEMTQRELQYQNSHSHGSEFTKPGNLEHTEWPACS